MYTSRVIRSFAIQPDGGLQWYVGMSSFSRNRYIPTRMMIADTEGQDSHGHGLELP